MIRSLLFTFTLLASATAFAQDINPHQLVLDQTLKVLSEGGAKAVPVEGSTLCSKVKADQDERTLQKNLKTSYPVYAFQVTGGDTAVYKLVNTFAESLQAGYAIDDDVNAVRSSTRPEVSWEKYAGYVKQEGFQKSRFYYVFFSKSAQKTRDVPVRLEFSSWQRVPDNRTTELCLSTWVD